MAEVLLFHHAQGLTEGVLALADQLRGAGHTVHTPDLYDGHTFATREEGQEYVEQIGFGAILENGIGCAAPLGHDLVYAGISLGVMPAQALAQNRSGARGALLLESCVPPAEFGSGWPPGVPVQVHGMENDPVFALDGDLDAARALAAEVDDAELFVYPGDQHLFVDSSLASYDAEAAALVTERVLGFLERV